MFAQRQGRLLLLTLTNQQEAWECKKKLEGDTARTADPNWSKAYSTASDVILSNKIWGKERTFRVLVFVFPSKHYAWWSPAFLEMAEHLPANGKYWINSLFYFACTRIAVALLIKLSLSQATSFLTFTLLILSPIPPGGSEQVAVWGLVASWG